MYSNTHSFDIDLPLEVDDEYWEADEPHLAFRQPPNKPSTITSFVAWLEMGQTITFALKTLVRERNAGFSFDLVDLKSTVRLRKIKGLSESGETDLEDCNSGEIA